MYPEQRLEKIVRKYFGVRLTSELKELFERAESKWRIHASTSIYKTLKGINIRGNIAYSLDAVCRITGKGKRYFENLIQKELISYFSIKKEILIPGYEIMRMYAQPDEDADFTPEMIAQKYGLPKVTIEAFKEAHLLKVKEDKISGSSLLKLYRAVAEYKQGYSGKIPEENYGNYKRENGKPLEGGKGHPNKAKAKDIDLIVSAVSDSFKYNNPKTYFVMLFATENPDGIGMIYAIPKIGEGEGTNGVKELKEGFVDFFRRWHGASGAYFFKKGVQITLERDSTWYIGGMHTERKNELREAIKKLGIHVHGDSEWLSEAERQKDKAVIEIISQAVNYLQSLGKLIDTEVDLERYKHHPFITLLDKVAALYKRNYRKAVRR